MCTPAPRDDTARAVTNSSTPRFSGTEVATTASQCIRGVRAVTSAMHAPAVAASTLSHFVTARTPRRMPSAFTMPMCSADWGIHPSAASTTKSTHDTALTPEIIVRTKSTWPGTSTKLRTVPSGAVAWAKPRSIVIPRRCSSS